MRRTVDARDRPTAARLGVVQARALRSPPGVADAAKPRVDRGMRGSTLRLWRVIALALLSAPPFCVAAAAPGLVGHWTFDDGTGRDRSGQGNDATLAPARIHALGRGKACLQLEPGQPGMSIPVTPGSSLAIDRGTVCFWLNMGPTNSTTVLEFDNRAVELRTYRSHFQPRFRGDGQFNFGSGLLGADWPNFLLRESAFYPHERAVTGEGEWHHFAVAYDVSGKRIIGWRDGERIAVVDLSTAGMEPLRRAGLKRITTGAQFSGFIDELRIYDRPLEDAAVREIHRAEAGDFAGRQDAVSSHRELRVYSYREEDRSLYRGWLQHRPVSSAAAELTRRIAASGDDPTIRNAARELAAALGEMIAPAELVGEDRTGPRIVLGTPESSAWIRRHTGELGTGDLRYDGFVLKTLMEDGHPVAVVAAREPAGVVFGVFDLIRRLQLGGDPARLDAVSSPTIPIRMVNHWDVWRGFPHDAWRGADGEEAEGDLNRSNSIYSWEDLRRGDTRRVRDWARLLASAGWNAVCPTEINWEPRNNFLEHLDEVKTLAALFRDYGIRLYWSPNYLLALRRETADRLYAAVPDFGGYLLKLGSEAQEGDPRPAMVNRIADHLKPHGGHALVRAFVYGKYRYSADDIRNLNPYDVIAAGDGNYRDNVVLVSKGSPLDWDFSAPIPALDGAIRRNTYGTELVIAKTWPLSWIEKWKWWLEQDNYRRGVGSLNKFDVRCILGVAMINPAPGWTACPLNMVNYYALGRLAQTPDLTVDELYTEWIRLTFGDDPEVVATIKTILLLSDDATRNLYTYRGYRGVWIDLRDKIDLVQNKTPHTITRAGVGIASPELRERVLAQYAPGLRELYGDPMRGEEFFASFSFLPHDHTLSNGRTVIQDLYANLDDAVELAMQLPSLWQRLSGKIDERRFRIIQDTLQEFARSAARDREATIKGLESVTGRKRDTTMESLRSAQRHFDIRRFGARGDGATLNTAALQSVIDACHAAGGGTVFVPAGIFVTGPLALRNGVSLSLDAGAVLRAASAAGPSSPLLQGKGVVKIAVLGPGRIDSGSATSGFALRLDNCREVQLRGLTIEHGGECAAFIRQSTFVRIDNVTIHAAATGVRLAECSELNLVNSHLYSVRQADGAVVAAGAPIQILGHPSHASSSDAGISIRNCLLVGHSGSLAGLNEQAHSNVLSLQNNCLRPVAIEREHRSVRP